MCPHEMHHGDAASIERRVRGDGTVAFRVVWRDPTQPGRKSLTLDDRRQAAQTIKLLDANGQRLTLAVEVANAIRQGGPTVEDAVREHIELLNRVGEDPRSGYRFRARDHITPYLGALPVKALTWQQVSLSAMNTAVRLGYRADNPCAAVRLPRNQRAGDDMPSPPWNEPIGGPTYWSVTPRCGPRTPVHRGDARGVCDDFSLPGC